MAHEPYAGPLGPYVAGAWLEPRALVHEVQFPYDQTVVARLAAARREDTLAAIQAAEDCFRAGGLPTHRREQILLGVADGLRSRGEEFAWTLVHEVGKTLTEAWAEVTSAEAMLRALSRAAMETRGHTVPLSANPGLEDRLAYWEYVPAGPVCGIGPFNAPLNNAVNKMGGAVAAGNSVVYKPANTTPLTALMLASLFEAQDIPRGLVNVVFGPRSDVADVLVADRRFRRYSFTGSVSVGEHIASSVGATKCLLEMGANSPVIVCRDADLELAAARCAASSYVNAGQICTAVQQVFVEEPVLEDFAGAFMSEAAKIQVGDPRLPDTSMGPVHTPQDADRVLNVFSEAAARDARALFGGNRDGCLVEPMAVINPDPTCRLSTEEVFGPLTGIRGVKDVASAVELANDSDFGLQVGVFTSSLAAATSLARDLQYGAVLVNEASRLRLPQGPFGGIKSSGTGREGGHFTIEELSEIRLVVIRPQ